MAIFGQVPFSVSVEPLELELLLEELLELELLEELELVLEELLEELEPDESIKPPSPL